MMRILRLLRADLRFDKGMLKSLANELGAVYLLKETSISKKEKKWIEIPGG